MGKSIDELIQEYFKQHPLIDMQHGPVVDWVEAKYRRLYGKKPRDTWRQIRKLHQEGFLIKVRKGIYKYDPHFIKQVELFDFSPETKEEILKRDNYKCVFCARSNAEGIELCVDHMTPKDKGGDNTIENGATMCMECNLRKKNYGGTEAGKRYFIRLYQRAVAISDEKIIKFCRHLFDVYDEHQVNGHIPRPNGIRIHTK